MLEAAGEGWTLIGYEALDEEQKAILPGATYLLSPEGKPYVVPTAHLGGWTVVDWLPRSPLVVAIAEDASVHVLDLNTGEAGPGLGFGMTVGPTYEVSAQFVGDGSSDVLATTWSTSSAQLSLVGADGAVRATTGAFDTWYGTAHWIQSPDRMRVVVNDAGYPKAFLTAGLQQIVLPKPYLGRLNACRVWMWADPCTCSWSARPAARRTSPSAVRTTSSGWCASTRAPHDGSSDPPCRSGWQACGAWVTGSSPAASDRPRASPRGGRSPTTASRP